MSNDEQEEETQAENEQEESEAEPVAATVQEEQQAEPPQASAADADGTSEAAPAAEAVSELYQHPDGRFETVVQNPIRNEE